MCSSNTITTIIICVVFLGISLGITLPLIFKTDDGLELIVYSKQGKSIDVAPRYGFFEIPDELWDDPAYISDHITFKDGIIEIKKPGIYQLDSTTSFYIENHSEENVMGTAFGRVIQGDIHDRFDYEISSILSIDAVNIFLNSYDTGFYNMYPKAYAVLKNTMTVKIEKENIDNGTNKIAPQYVFKHFDDDDLYQDVVISRDTREVKTDLMLKKIQSKIKKPKIKIPSIGQNI